MEHVLRRLAVSNSIKDASSLAEQLDLIRTFCADPRSSVDDALYAASLPLRVEDKKDWSLASVAHDAQLAAARGYMCRFSTDFMFAPEEDLSLLLTYFARGEGGKFEIAASVIGSRFAPLLEKSMSTDETGALLAIVMKQREDARSEVSHLKAERDQLIAEREYLRLAMLVALAGDDEETQNGRRDTMDFLWSKMGEEAHERTNTLVKAVKREP